MVHPIHVRRRHHHDVGHCQSAAAGYQHGCRLDQLSTKDGADQDVHGLSAATDAVGQSHRELLTYQWDLLRGADEERILGELPRSLQQRVANIMCRDLVASIPFLRKANNALLNALAESAEYNLNIYSPNDDILKPGERIKGTLLISRGEVEVLRPVGDNNKGNGGGETIVERKLQSFDRFAEESLFVPTVCDRYVRAKTFCEVFLLPADDFQHIIASHCDDAHIAHLRTCERRRWPLPRVLPRSMRCLDRARMPSCFEGLRSICLPTSTFRRPWSVLQLLGVVYYIWTLPLSMMHFFQPTAGEGTFSDGAVMLSFGYVVDIFFLVNLILTSSYFVYLEQVLVVFDSERIRQEFYRTHRIGLEAIAAVPLEVLLLVPVMSSYCHFFRMNKLLRLPKIFRCTRCVERALADHKVGLNQSAARAFKLNFVMAVVCHWVACLWHAYADFSVRAGAADNWREADEADETLAIDHEHLGGSGYLRAIYWAIVGMSTVGYGKCLGALWGRTKMTDYGRKRQSTLPYTSQCRARALLILNAICHNPMFFSSPSTTYSLESLQATLCPLISTRRRSRP